MKHFLLLCLGISCSALAQDPSIYLDGRLERGNGRYKTFHEALRLITERNVKVLVETGTARCGDTNFDGDGGSTILFSHWAQVHNAHFYSVDISEAHIDIARKAVSAYKDSISFVLGDSAQFLEKFEGNIDFLYLDSWDYDDKNPPPAQIHCLKEIQAAYDKLTPQSIIMIDDCNIPGGGKGKLAIEWLLKQGWYLHVNKHHVILLKK